VTEQHPAVAYLEAAHQRALVAGFDAAEENGERWAESGDAVYTQGMNNPVAVGPWTGSLPDGTRRHIALNDPRSVLRRIKAEKKILDEHHAVSYAGLPPWCAKCVHMETSEVQPPRKAVPGLAVTEFPHDPWPCATVLNLAAGWGWEAE